MTGSGRRRALKVIVLTGFRAAPGLMMANLALSIASGVGVGALPYAVKRFVDGVGNGDSHQLALGAALLTVSVCCTYGPAFLMGTMGAQLGGHVSLYVTGRVGELAGGTAGIEHFERPDYLRELELLSQNGQLLGQGPTNCMLVLQSVIRAVLSVALLITISPVLSLIAVLAVLPFLGARHAVKLREHLDEELAEDRRLVGELFSLAATAAPAREARIYGLTEAVRQRHAVLTAGISSSVVRTNVVTLLITCGTWLVFAAGFVAAVVFVVVRAAHGDATPGAVILVLQIGRGATFNVGAIAGAMGQLLTIARATQRYLWLEDYAAASAGVPDDPAPIPGALQHGITFQDVTFRYPGTEVDVLHHVNLHLPAGSTVAIVGENGAGKTTLVKLLSGMYQPTSGRILVDGIDLRQLPLADWRRQLAAAFQDFTRYEIRAGEAVGVGDLPRIHDTDAIHAALDRASAADVIASLDQGLETPLSRLFEGGRELSGGQWQKLALGRGMMREGPLLLLLDEPTASLDAATEHGLFQRYADAARRAGNLNGAITVLISHRFSTVQMADLIAVVDSGATVEIGTHTDLLAAGGTYAELYRLQARAYR